MTKLLRVEQFITLGTVLLFLLVGCNSAASFAEEASAPVMTPTVHHVFSRTNNRSVSQQSSEQGLLNTPTFVPHFAQMTVAAPVTEVVQPEITPLPTVTVRPTPVTRVVTVFDDALNAGWSLENSYGVEYKLRERLATHNGRFSMSFTPQVGYGNLIFAVRPESEEEYLREDVLAVRFWLYSGDDYVNTDDLLVSIVGSNEYAHWVEEDNSVQVNDSRPTFPSTRLYFLNVEDDIPPDTWIRIEVWLNELIYDPDYQYVTGIIIKNDEDFLRTVYIDEVEMVMVMEK
jgi:hypothetical protein